MGLKGSHGHFRFYGMRYSHILSPNRYKNNWVFSRNSHKIQSVVKVLRHLILHSDLVVLVCWAQIWWPCDLPCLWINDSPCNIWKLIFLMTDSGNNLVLETENQHSCQKVPFIKHSDNHFKMFWPRLSLTSRDSWKWKKMEILLSFNHHQVVLLVN